MSTALVIAAHGTRDPEGEAACRELVARVAERLAPVPVHVGFVELNEPGIAEALASALASADEVAVVPLMLGTGGHVRQDIPEAIEAGRAAHARRGATSRPSEATVVYADPLGHDPRLLAALQARVTEAVGDWDRRDAHVVLLGRGAAVAQANADHARLARLVYEGCDVAAVVPAYSQVARPSIPEVLNQLAAGGAQHLVVAANLLFPGRLRTWLREQVAAWAAGHPGVEVRVADVLGPCEELVDVVVDRYREALAVEEPEEGSPAYLTGLLLAGRDVLMVGAGRVADRRVPKLLAAGSRVRVVSPTLSVKMARLARAGDVAWTDAPFEPAMLDDVWFCLAQTNDPEVNAAVAAACEERRIFCVRADDARHGTAWTPATDRVAGVTVGVLGDRRPALSRRVRDAVLAELLG